MTINSTTRKAGPFSGTGSQTAYPFAFKVFTASDVLVVETDANGAESTLALNADYTVALNADQNASPGGTVTMLVAPPAGYKLTLGSAVATTQGQSIPNNGGFYPKVVEDGLDRLTILVQQLFEQAGRAVKFAFSDSSTGALPTAQARANNLLGFDSNGNPIAVTPAAGTATALSTSLASSTGGGMVGWIQSGIGAIARWIQDKLRESVSVDDFGAVGDGITDDTAAFQAAINAVSTAGGGTVRFFKRHLIDNNLTVADGVWLRGPLGMPGELLPGTSADYDSKRGVLVINSAATITVKDAASATNFVAIRKGLDLPFPDASTATNGVNAFAGTAFTVGGADAMFSRLLILGFNLAVSSSGYERVRCDYVTGDCTNGLSIYNCADISYITRCHFWPWTTVHQTWTTNALLRRSGTAYLFANVCDWGKVTDCFSYGYYRGFRAASVNSMTFMGCGADNTSTSGVGDYAGALGFTAEGSSNDTRFIGCQAAAQASAFYVSTTAGLHTRLIGCDSWAASSNGVIINSGDVEISGGAHRNTVTGVNINSGASRVFVDGVRFAGLSSKPIGFSVSNSTTFLGPNNDYSDIVDGSTPIANPANWPIRSIASGDPLMLPANGHLFQVTGSTNFGSVQGGWKGREVTLLFSGALTITSSNAGATTNLRLSGNANFSTQAGSTLTLKHNGTQWFETGRGA